MKNPLVSVIMPVYNGANTIKVALQSLLAQSYSNWECIIVNDGSTDNTIHILQAYNDNRIRIVNFERNTGRGKARNEALQHCTGEYLCFLDADDFLHPDKLKKQVSTLQEGNCSMVGCAVIKFDENCKANLSAGYNNIGIRKHKDGKKLPLFLPTVMIKRDLCIEYSYNLKLDVGEDYDFLSRCIDGFKYTNLLEPLYFYRVDNTTRSKLLYYTKENIRSGFYLSKRNLVAGIEMMASFSVKYLIYFFWSLIVDTKKILNRRGNIVTSQEMDLFNEIYNTLIFVDSERVKI